MYPIWEIPLYIYDATVIICSYLYRFYQANHSRPHLIAGLPTSIWRVDAPCPQHINNLLILINIMPSISTFVPL